MNSLRLTFVNVGYGEAILLEVSGPATEKNPFTMIVDGGSGDEKEFENSKSGRIPFAEYLKKENIHHLDLVVNTHVHEDHTSGLVPLAAMYRPYEFWSALPASYDERMKDLDPGTAEIPTGAKYLQSINDYHEICEVLKGKGCEIRQVRAGDREEPVKGLKISVIAPSKKKEEDLEQYFDDMMTAEDAEALRPVRNRADAAMNNLSIMLLIEYAGRKILLPGDTNMNGYGDLADVDLSADIFKVGHHGQKDGISRELFHRIHPEYVVCCASSDRRYESAAPQILKMMQGEGSKLTFSDCPDVPPYTDDVKVPHSALIYEISESGEIRMHYE